MEVGRVVLPYTEANIDLLIHEIVLHGPGAKAQLTVLITLMRAEEAPNYSRRRSYASREVRASLWEQKRHPHVTYDYDAESKSAEE